MKIKITPHKQTLRGRRKPDLVNTKCPAIHVPLLKWEADRFGMGHSPRAVPNGKQAETVDGAEMQFNTPVRYHFLVFMQKDIQL